MTPKRNWIFFILFLGFSIWVKDLVEVFTDETPETKPTNAAEKTDEISDLMITKAAVNLPSARQPSTVEKTTVPDFNLAASPNPDLGPTATRALEYLTKHQDDYRIRGYHKFKVKDVKESPLGSDVTFEFEQDGIPIVGLNLNMHFSPDGKMTDVTNRYFGVPQIDTSIAARPDEILPRISNVFLPDPSSTTPPAKIIYYEPGNGEAVLAYTFQVQEARRSARPADVVLRADDGQLLKINYARKEF